MDTILTHLGSRRSETGGKMEQFDQEAKQHMPSE